MPEGVPLFAVAAMVSSAGKDEGGAARRLLGDGLVPLESALGRHANPALDLGLPPERQWVAYGATHLDLLSSPEVYERLRDWVAAIPGREKARGPEAPGPDRNDSVSPVSS
jgi:hypothetical protein